MNFKQLAHKFDAVESGRTKLRGYILIIKEIARTLQTKQRKAEEEASAGAAVESPAEANHCSGHLGCRR